LGHVPEHSLFLRLLAGDSQITKKHFAPAVSDSA